MTVHATERELDAHLQLALMACMRCIGSLHGQHSESLRCNGLGRDCLLRATCPYLCKETTSGLYAQLQLKIMVRRIEVCARNYMLVI